MRFGWFFGIACAVLIHAGVIAFGGLIVAHGKKDQGTLQKVELLSEKDAEKEKEKKEEPKPEQKEELKTETEQAPDSAEVIRNLEASATDNTPKLEAASLSAIEAALSGQAGEGGDFAEAMSFASGGRIGGTGKAGAQEQELDKAFSLAEIDQKPRAVFQAAPVYPPGMRSVEGVVNVIFVVDERGKVMNPKVEKSTHREFERPALDAVRQWKFEPAVKGGKRVACKMRVPIRFQPRQGR